MTNAKSARQSQPTQIDSDYAWLKTHSTPVGAMDSRNQLVHKIATGLRERIESKHLPYTLGVFGGWGTGKTTLLALLAEELERTYRVVYFNSWKYAGFMEIVPALIYKVLQCGIAGTETERDEAARRVLLALGNNYSDQIGSWAKTKIGINPVELFKDLYDSIDAVDRNSAPPTIIRAYYTQVDKAQDELRRALGTVSGVGPSHTVVVLIDELDRCDPDEAFNVIKQMRVLFGMRDLPIIFVVCANAEPIGLAIKHHYGLDSEGADYEARRILEKFVDSYEDLSSSEALGPVVRAIWERESLPWLMQFDEDNVGPEFGTHVLFNATAFDALTTSIPLFTNIRVLHKSFEYVKSHDHENVHLLWTKWFLEAARQIDPKFRRDIYALSQPIEKACRSAYESMHQVKYQARETGHRRQIRYETDKGHTLFAIYRSFFWIYASEELERLRVSADPEEQNRFRALAALLADPLKMDTVVLLSLLPFEKAPSFQELSLHGEGMLPDLRGELHALVSQLGYELSRRAV